MTKDSTEKIHLETMRMPSAFELEQVTKTYSNFYKWRNYRSGSIIQFQGKDLETYLKESREMFWNSFKTPSEDLRNLGLDFSIDFARKETLDFIGRMVAQNIDPQLTGEDLDAFGVKVLQSIYSKWRFKSNDPVEKFWDMLYGCMNGTIVKYVGFDDSSSEKRFLTGYNRNTGQASFKYKQIKKWNDVRTRIAALEDIYVPKIWERDMQKMGALQWKEQIDFKEFRREYKTFKNAEFVYPGNRIAEDSLYYELLGGTGVVSSDKVELIKEYDEIDDVFKIVATGVLLNGVKEGNDEATSPMPFNHKTLPFVKAVFEPLDEKFFYGLSLPFKIKDPSKLLNVQITMLMERELRTIDPPILTDDIEAPKLIFGQNAVIPVGSVDSYKEMEIKPASNDYFATMSMMQNYITTHAQGGQAAAIGGKQPTSAKQQAVQEQLKNLFLENSLLMYKDMLRQEIMLVLKTALQFYAGNKYKKVQDRIIRVLKLPNSPLMMGGTGNLEVRIVKKKQDDIVSFFEAVAKTVQDGKMTEIIEAPFSVLEDMEFMIDDITMEPKQTTETKQALFMENVIQPMVQIYGPAGLADMSKVFLRHLEKLGEHPSDYASDKVLGQIMQIWTNSFQMPSLNGDGGNGDKPDVGKGDTTGNLIQSVRGMQNGGNRSGAGSGYPAAKIKGSNDPSHLGTKFGQPEAWPMSGQY